MSRYAEAAAAVTQPSSHATGACSVSGCPMPGTVADGTNGSGDWVCSLHHGVPYTQQAGVTTRIANRRALFVLAGRLSNADAALLVPQEVRHWLRRHGREDFADWPSRTARQLGARMLLVLHNECRAPQQGLPKEKRQGAESWANARTLLEGLA